MGTKMAAAFPGLHDRLVHFTSAPVMMPAVVVEAEKLDDDKAEPPVTPNVVEAGADVDKPLADEPPALTATEGVLVDDGMGVKLVDEPEV